MKATTILLAAALASTLAFSTGPAMATDFNHAPSGMKRTYAFHGVSSRRMPGETMGIGIGRDMGMGLRENDPNVYRDRLLRDLPLPNPHGG